MSNLLIDRPLSRPASFLRVVLVADAVASGATGLLTVLGAGVLAQLLGMSAALLRGAGQLLLPYVAFVALSPRARACPGRRSGRSSPATHCGRRASLALLASGLLAPTVLGYAFVAAQALLVALFGWLQYVGLQRQMSA